MHRNQKGKNHKFISHHVKQQFDIGGTQVFLHKFIGPDTTNVDTEVREFGDLSQPFFDIDGERSPFDIPESNIQDLLYLENRDRKYDPNVYEFRGTYTVNDNDFSLSQFGWMMPGDTIMLSFHYDDMIARFGRKFMSGDVIELSHLRDMDLLDPQRPAINKYYVIQEASRGADGFDAHWNYHTWRCRCTPMNNQQEFLDILTREAMDINDEPLGQTLEEIVSTLPKELEISRAIDAEADRKIPYRNYEHFHLFVTPRTDPETGEYIPFSTEKYPILLNFGDGKPPNGAREVGYGPEFPETATEGDFWLRTDFVPNALYRRELTMWVREEIDYRTKWSAAHDALRNLINRTSKMKRADTGEEINQRVALSKVIKPRSDF